MSILDIFDIYKRLRPISMLFIKVLNRACIDRVHQQHVFYVIHLFWRLFQTIYRGNICVTMSNAYRKDQPPTGRPVAGSTGRPSMPRPAATMANLQKPGTARPFAAIPYKPEEEQKIQRALNKVLGPEYVSFRPGGGGQNVSYIEGWKVLNLANEIFGFNGWSSELISVQVDFLDSHGSGRVSLGLSVVVRITIRDGTFHEDFGYGFIENAKNKAMAFEKCKKEAFTDGLKRCLRCFGNVLGNCLYDKSIIAKMQKVKLPQRELEADDFYRDPLVLKREMERRVPPPAALTPPVSKPIPSVPPTRPAPQQAHPKAAADVTPAVVKGYGLDDFDDLFQFSDDLPAEGSELNDGLDDYDLKPLQSTSADHSMTADEKLNGETKAPEQVFFTSSKKALDIQQTPDVTVPVFDHKFVAASVRRTVDPSKSVKVRRPDGALASTMSQAASARTYSPSLSSGPQIGKRPLGMPPSQRPAPKKAHIKSGEDITVEQG